MKKCRRKDDKCSGFCVGGGGDGGDEVGDRERAKSSSSVFFSLSLTEPVKALAKLFHHGFAFLPCCPAALSPLSSLLSLFTHSSVPDSHTRCFCSSFIFGASPRSADYWTSDLCRDLSSPTSPPRSLSFYLLPSPVCPFPLSSRRSLPLSLCCNNSELWAVGRRAY